MPARIAAAVTAPFVERPAHAEDHNFAGRAKGLPWPFRPRHSRLSTGWSFSLRGGAIAAYSTRPSAARAVGLECAPSMLAGQPGLVLADVLAGEERAGEGAGYDRGGRFVSAERFGGRVSVLG
jgi:hypothetical protein